MADNFCMVYKSLGHIQHVAGLQNDLNMQMHAVTRDKLNMLFKTPSMGYMAIWRQHILREITIAQVIAALPNVTQFASLRRCVSQQADMTAMLAKSLEA